MPKKMIFIIPMAGKGSRFAKEGYDLPKYMLEVNGKTLFEYSINSLPLDIADKIIFVCLENHESLGVSKFIKEKTKHKNIEIIKLKNVTRGQAETIYKCKNHIDSNDEILIYNIDTAFSSKNLKKVLRDKKTRKDGVIGAFIDKSSDNKWSFASLDDSNNVARTEEKEKISDYALTGLYHFSKASDFFDTAKKYIENDLTVRGEFYVAPMYNDLIRREKKYVLDIVEDFIPLGTPKDLKVLESKTSGVILTSATADITVCEVFGDLPTGLIPVNGKPIIFFILQQMLENDIKDVYIGVDYKQEKLKEVINTYFSAKLNISYIYTDKTKGPGNSLLKILQVIKSGKVVVNLGDTYIKNFDYKNFNDSIIVSKDYLDEERWATVVSKDDLVVQFTNKEKTNSKNTYAICGLYSLNNVEVFNRFRNKNIIQINDLLKYYNETNKLKVQKTDAWLDFGHIDKYYVSKKRLIQSRGFNSLEYDDLLGTITKRSENKEKFRAEIKWQINLPKNIQVLAPRVLDYSLDESPFVCMEFYSYPTLAEIFLFSELNEKVYFSIIDNLFKVLELFSKNKKEVSQDDYNKIYIKKTIQRIHLIVNEQILELFKNDTITINGEVLQNWKILKNNIFNNIESLYYKKDNCFLHGDFCLSNILYDLRSGIVRLIDPRGIWGSNENGDIKYDIAKLRHSICGDYDYIVNDLFKIKLNENEIKYSTFNSDRDSIKNYFDLKLSESYDINQIKLIEGLLFLSMIPLHKDNKKRQLVMYSKAIELLNQIEGKI